MWSNSAATVRVTAKARSYRSRNMSQTQHTGACACGAVTYTVMGELTDVIACHCETCRRTSGYYWGATHADKNALEIHGGNALRWWHSSDIAQRGFCRYCGSSLFYSRHDAPYVAIAPGTLDDASNLSTRMHIFCAEAGTYYRLDETTRRHPKWGPGFDLPIA